MAKKVERLGLHKRGTKVKSYTPPSIPKPVAYKLQQLAADENYLDAVNWIINELCATYDMSFRPESNRETDFAEGRRFVGLQLVRWIKTNLSIYETDEEKTNE